MATKFTFGSGEVVVLVDCTDGKEWIRRSEGESKIGWNPKMNALNSYREWPGELRREAVAGMLVLFGEHSFDTLAEKRQICRSFHPRGNASIRARHRTLGVFHDNWYMYLRPLFWLCPTVTGLGDPSKP